MLARLRQWARIVRRDVHAIYYIGRDPRVPWPVKALAVALAAYALSPIDLIPDVIPVLGLVDDLILLPLGVLLVIRLVPADVLADCRRRAEAQMDQPRGKWAVVAIVGIWIALASLIAIVVWRRFA